MGRKYLTVIEISRTRKISITQAVVSIMTKYQGGKYSDFKRNKHLGANIEGIEDSRGKEEN